MEITEIRLKPGTKDVYEIYVDGILVAEVNEVDLYKFAIYKKRKLTKEELKELLNKIRFSKAKEIAIKYVMYKKRTTFEVRNKLQGFDNLTIEKVIDVLLKAGYLDDKKYIRDYIVDRQRVANWSVNKIKMSLLQKGIKIEDIDYEIVDMGYDEVEKAEVMLDKLIQSKIIPNDYEGRMKIKKYLYNKGFSIETIDSVMRDYVSRER